MTSVPHRTESAVLRPHPESDNLPEPMPGELSRRENSLPNSEPTCDERLVGPLDWRRRAPFSTRNPRRHPEPSGSRSRQRWLHCEGIPGYPGCGLAWAYKLRGYSYQMPVLWGCRRIRTNAVRNRPARTLSQEGTWPDGCPFWKETHGDKTPNSHQTWLQVGFSIMG